MEAMEVVSSIEARSENCGPKPEEFGPDFHQLGGLMAVPPETGSSFTALLELPANQAVELLVHSADSVDTPPPSHPPAAMAKLSGEAFNQQCLPGPLPLSICPFDAAVINSAARFSVFASSGNSPESSRSKPPRLVKQEPGDSDSNPNSSPAVSYPTIQKQSNKRKDREKKAKESNKKNKKALANETSTAEENGGEKLPYVHVRARRGQATDSHSLAERARREKINARMKLLQELVPGCNKISGTASVLDEIINHVQSLQHQVEFLSMRLAAVNPSPDFNLDNFMAAENVSPLESNFSGMIMPSVGPEGGIRPQSQQLWHSDGFHQPILNREETPSNFVAPEISPLRYDSSADSAFLDSSKLKMEL